jgi:hypothetical protein
VHTLSCRHIQFVSITNHFASVFSAGQNHTSVVALGIASIPFYKVYFWDYLTISPRSGNTRQMTTQLIWKDQIISRDQWPSFTTPTGKKVTLPPRRYL